LPSHTSNLSSWFEKFVDFSEKVADVATQAVALKDDMRQNSITMVKGAVDTLFHNEDKLFLYLVDEVTMRPILPPEDDKEGNDIYPIAIETHNDTVKKLLRPRVVIGIPVGITNVEMRAVYDAAKSAGAREVYIVEEPMAAAIGVHMPVHDPVGSMMVDIDGGTTDIAVIALSGVVRAKSIKIAGDKLTQDIISYMRDEFKMLVGEKTAEHIKVNIGSALPDENGEELSIKGRDLVTGLPREAVITDVDIREAMYGSISQLVDAVREVLETTPPEVLADIMQKGMTLSGGGALIKNLPQLLEMQLKVPVTVADDPLTAVARGCGIILEDVTRYKDVLIQDTNDISFR
jgi:rod shape-determining protein MreB